jgi:hypothetical protein
MKCSVQYAGDLLKGETLVTVTGAGKSSNLVKGGKVPFRKSSTDSV